MKIIDLTMPLNPDTPVYPGDPSIELTVAADLHQDGYLDHLIKLGTHNGTHIDAPSHMVEDGKMLNEFSLETFVGEAVTLDARKGFDALQLEDYDIRAGDIVLICTGMSDDYKSESYYTDYEAVPLSLAEKLVELKVKLVGVDMGSIDHEPFPVHKKLLGSNVLIVENLVNLSSLIGDRYRVTALPLNLNVEASPARVIAEQL